MKPYILIFVCLIALNTMAEPTEVAPAAETTPPKAIAEQPEATKSVPLKVNAEPTKSRLFGSISMLYDTSTKIDALGSVNGTSFSGTYYTKGAPGLEISIEWNEEQSESSSAGFELGFAYFLDKNINNVSVNEGSASVTAPSDQSISILLWTLSPKVYYRHFFLFAGINYPLVQVTGSQLKIDGGLGYQAGFGMMLNKNWGADFQYRILNASGSEDLVVGSTPVHGTFDSLTDRGVVVSAHYSFR